MRRLVLRRKVEAEAQSSDDEAAAAAAAAEEEDEEEEDDDEEDEEDEEDDDDEDDEDDEDEDEIEPEAANVELKPGEKAMVVGSAALRCVSGAAEVHGASIPTECVSSCLCEPIVGGS